MTLGLLTTVLAKAAPYASRVATVSPNFYDGGDANVMLAGGAICFAGDNSWS